jgi:hypothetical protein
VYFQDPETGHQVWVDTADRNVRNRYRELVAARDAELAQMTRRTAVDMLQLSTAISLVDPLVKFVTFRRRRRWSSPGQ